MAQTATVRSKNFFPPPSLPIPPSVNRKNVICAALYRAYPVRTETYFRSLYFFLPPPARGERCTFSTRQHRSYLLLNRHFPNFDRLFSTTISSDESGESERCADSARRSAARRPPSPPSPRASPSPRSRSGLRTSSPSNPSWRWAGDREGGHYLARPER